MTHTPAYNTAYYLNKHVLLIGGLGFIGSNLAHILHRLGAHVTVIEKTVQTNSWAYENNKDILDNITVIACDAMDTATLRPHIIGKDIICNLISIHPKDKERELVGEHISFHASFLELCKKENPQAAIVFFGTRMVYGDTKHLPLTEDHPLNPKTHYAVERAMSELLYRHYHDAYGLRTICFRIANPYGPYGNPEKEYPLLNKLVWTALQNETLHIYGDGEEYKDYIYIDDLVEAILKMIQNESCRGGYYNLGSGIKETFKDAVHQIVHLAGSGKIDHVHDTRIIAGKTSDSFYLDIRKLQHSIHWEPRVTLSIGLQKTIGYYRAHLNAGSRT